GNLQAGEEVGCGRFGGGGDDERGDAGGGEEAGAVVPNAGIVESPQQSADVDDDDKGDEHAAKELELGMDAAGLDVVFGAEVVAPQQDRLKDVDAADGEPAESDHEQHDECLAQHGFEIARQIRDGGQDHQQAGEKKDGASWLPQVLLQSPASGVTDRFLPVQDAEENVMDNVCDDEHAAEDEDCEEPIVLEMKDGEG